MAINAQIDRPGGLALDGQGNLYIADIDSNCIRKIDQAGYISTIAGQEIVSNERNNDDEKSTEVQLTQPHDIAVDTAGNLYIADTGNHRIRKVDTEGLISTIAGTGTAGDYGDRGQAISAQLNRPKGIAVDNLGNIYIADTNNHRVRKVNTAGNITTLAGNGRSGYSGNEVPASNAQLSLPISLAVDKENTVYVVDQGNHRLRQIIPSQRLIGIPSRKDVGNHEIVLQVSDGSKIVDEQSFTIKVLPLLPKPATILTPALTTTVQANLSWDDKSDNETGFTIYRDGEIVGSAGPNVTTFRDEGLEPNTTYTYSIAATNEKGESTSQEIIVNTSDSDAVSRGDADLTLTDLNSELCGPPILDNNLNVEIPCVALEGSEQYKQVRLLRILEMPTSDLTWIIESHTSTTCQSNAINCATLTNNQDFLIIHRVNLNSQRHTAILKQNNLGQWLYQIHYQAP